MVGPFPLLWPLLLPPHQVTLGSWPYGWVASTSGPPLEERRSRRRRPGPRKLETAAHQGKALAVEVLSTEEQARPTECLRHLCDMKRSRAKKRTMHFPPSTAGWIPQGGGRPRLWRFFPRFLIGEKSGPAERPWKGADLCLRNQRRVDSPIIPIAMGMPPPEKGQTFLDDWLSIGVSWRKRPQEGVP